MTTVTVGDIERAVARAFPTDRAEEWDRVGLLAGDPETPVTGVVLSLDPTPEAINRTKESGANVLVTHHPAYLKPAVPVAGGGGGGDALYRALSAGIALINAHTNLDRDPAAQTLMPTRLGLEALRPLERGSQPCALVTAYVPPSAFDEVARAMARAGAGRIGEYAACSFAGPGVGRFTPSLGASPASGSVGAPSEAEELRLEMVAPRARAARVVAAAVAAHPYEEPLVTVTEVSRARNGAALGMLARVEPVVTLGELVARAASAYGVTPRVWGEATRPVARVACGTGSAGSLIFDALAAGADVLMAGEVRYHDATDALDRGLSVVEIGHDVSEWPLVELLADVVRAVPGFDGDRIVTLTASARWWTP